MVTNRFASIEEENRILREALDAFEDSVSIYNAEGYHVYSSRSARVRFGTFYENLDKGLNHWDALAIAAKTLFPQLTATHVNTIVENARDRFEDGETYASVTDDNRNVQITYRTLSNGMRAGISVDVTEMRRRQAELEQARSAAEAKTVAKSQFLANMSHEIRTPLNGVLGMAQALLQDDISQEAQDKVQILIESSRTLMTVVNDILDLSKIEAGKVEFSPIPVEMRGGLKRIIELYRPKAVDKGIKLQLEIDIDLPHTLIFDPVRVRQCLTNLVTNAIKFTETGSVRVSAAYFPDDVAGTLELRVTDTGIGIDAEACSRLFEEFNQADNSTTRQFGGTGLGLAISRRLARAMGGDVTVASEPGRGSTFTLTVRAPVSEVAGQGPAEGTTTQRDWSGSRLLLVDDNAINRKVASLFLQPFGFTISEAEHGAAALALLESEPFDIVLMDVHMPVMDGREAVSRIRASGKPYAGIPIVALTADAMPGDRERFIAMGMDDYLAKPLDQRELFSVLNRMLRNTRNAA